jgi:hypothetical protein
MRGLQKQLQLDPILTLCPTSASFATILRSDELNRLGERSQALQLLKELKATSKKSFVPAFFFALVYAGLEDKDQAFAWLEKAYDERFTRFAYLKLEALWDPLRADHRFSDLLRRVGMPP